MLQELIQVHFGCCRSSPLIVPDLRGVRRHENTYARGYKARTVTTVMRFIQPVPVPVPELGLENDRSVKLGVSSLRQQFLLLGIAIGKLTA